MGRVYYVPSWPDTRNQQCSKMFGKTIQQLGTGEHQTPLTGSAVITHACTDPYIGIGWAYQSTDTPEMHQSRSTITTLPNCGIPRLRNQYTA